MKIMTNEDYHAHPAISSSKIKLLYDDPYAVEWLSKSPQDSEKTAALDIGSAVHAALLEPELYERDYVVMPDLNLRTNAGKAEKKAFIEKHAGINIITAQDHIKISYIVSSVLAHPQAAKLIKQKTRAYVERSFFWTDEETGINCRCRPDKLIFGEQTGGPILILDIKTTADNIDDFSRAIEKYKYYLQAAFYTDGLEAATKATNFEFVFLVIQKSISAGRYPVRLVKIADDYLKLGRAEYKEVLQNYKYYKDNIQDIYYQIIEPGYKMQQKIDDIFFVEDE